MIKLLVVGKVKDKNLNALITNYQEKINHYHKLTIIEVKDEPIRDNEEEVLDIEAQRLLNKIDKEDYVVLMDLWGKTIDSLTFAEKLDTFFVNHSRLCFVIGGSLGLGKAIRQRADEAIKLSDLTFLHQMTRLILLEQIYRAYKINNHETYHK